jgi:CBS domain-containing protein
MSVKVSDVMTRKIVCSSPDATAAQVAGLMRDNRISSIVIMSGTVITGIVTERDLVLKVISAGKDASLVLASELMSCPVLTVDSEAELEEAARVMRDNRVKKLIAMGEGGANGIISSFDIVVAEPVIRLLIERGI